MAYIDREQICENCNNKNYCEKEKCPVYKVSATDVVPKSEVEKIIEDTFKRIRENFVISPLCKVALSDLKAELKKKYTEQKECPTCKHFVGCEKANWIRGCEEYEETK